jgi:hypothetical protein
MDPVEFIRAQDDRSSTTTHREQQTIANVLYGRVIQQGDWGCLTKPPVKVCSRLNLPIVHGRVRHLKYRVSIEPSSTGNWTDVSEGGSLHMPTGSYLTSAADLTCLKTLRRAIGPPSELLAQWS